MTNMGRVLRRSGAALIGAAASIAVTHATSQADPAAPAAGHQVKYTVTTTSDLNAQIYYMKVEPPNQNAFNSDSSPYMVNDKVPVGPDNPWVFQTTMNDPNQWAIVSASGVLRTNPQFHCEISVDGVTVSTQDGGSGVQCALRPWGATGGAPPGGAPG
jgi:hypothetical protein